MPLKFSLQAIFAALTLSCFAALIYKQLAYNIPLINKIDAINTRIATYEPGLAKDVPWIQKSIGTSSRYTELHKKTVAEFDQAVKKLIADANQATTLSITYLPSLKVTFDETFLIFLPHGQTSRLTFETAEDNKNLPVFAPNVPFDFDLPSGLSTLIVSRDQQIFIAKKRAYEQVVGIYVRKSSQLSSSFK